MNISIRWAAVAMMTCLLAHAKANGAESYTVDGTHTSIIFGISHLGYSYTYGRFNKVKGMYMLDRANPSASRFQLAIDAASIDTNDPKRDAYLQGPDFFNARQFPNINFQSTKVVAQSTSKGMTFQVTGNLTIHGVTKLVTLQMRKLGEGNGPAGKYRTGFLCQHNIKRSDYGMAGMIPMVGDEVAITISFEGIRQGLAGGSGSAAGSGSAGGSGSAKKMGSGSSSRGSGSGTRQGSGSGSAAK